MKMGICVRDEVKDCTLRMEMKRCILKMLKRLVSRFGDCLDVAKGEEIKHTPQMWAGVIEREVILSTEPGKFCEET